MCDICIKIISVCHICSDSGRCVAVGIVMSVLHAPMHRDTREGNVGIVCESTGLIPPFELITWDILLKCAECESAKEMQFQIHAAICLLRKRPAWGGLSGEACVGRPAWGDLRGEACVGRPAWGGLREEGCVLGWGKFDCTEGCERAKMEYGWLWARVVVAESCGLFTGFLSFIWIKA